MCWCLCELDLGYIEPIVCSVRQKEWVYRIWKHTGFSKIPYLYHAKVSGHANMSVYGYVWVNFALKTCTRWYNSTVKPKPVFSDWECLYLSGVLMQSPGDKWKDCRVAEIIWTITNNDFILKDLARTPETHLHVRHYWQVSRKIKTTW